MNDEEVLLYSPSPPVPSDLLTPTRSILSRRVCVDHDPGCWNRCRCSPDGLQFPQLLPKPAFSSFGHKTLCKARLKFGVWNFVIVLDADCRVFGSQWERIITGQFMPFINELHSGFYWHAHKSYFSFSSNVNKLNRCQLLLWDVFIRSLSVFRNWLIIKSKEIHEWLNDWSQNNTWCYNLNINV